MENLIVNINAGKVGLENPKTQEDSVVGWPACSSFHKVLIEVLIEVVIEVDKYHQYQGELLVGCGDGELVMVVEGTVKKPPPGRVTFPTQVHLAHIFGDFSVVTLMLSEGLFYPVEEASKDDD